MMGRACRWVGICGGDHVGT